MNFLERYKIKKILCFFLCFLLIATIVTLKSTRTYADTHPAKAISFYNNTAYPHHIGYFEDNGKIYYAARAKTASTDTRFHTLGFQVEVTINQKTYYCRFKLGSDSMQAVSTQQSGGYTYTMWAMNFNLGSNNLIEYLNDKFPEDKSTFTKVGYDYDANLQFDAIITITEGKTHVPQGSMDANGTLHGEVYLTEAGVPQFNTKGIKKANSSWGFTTSYDDSKGGISTARTWGDPRFSDYFKIPLPITRIRIKKTIKIYYKDYNTHANIIPYTVFKTVSIIDPITIPVKYTKLTGYKLKSSAFRYDGETYTEVKGASATTRNIEVSKKHETEHVVFFYEPDIDPPQIGGIIFAPNHIQWTNFGKASEGLGIFPVNAIYVGKYPPTTDGTVQVNHTEESDGKKVTTTYPIHVSVGWPIKNIVIDGDASGIISGMIGVVNILKEGEDLQLHGKLAFGTPVPDYPPVADGDSIEYGTLTYPPHDPVEAYSGYYDIDWTKPNIKIAAADDKWHNDDPYNVNLKVNDALSGIDQEKSTVTVTDHSWYNHKIFDASVNDGDSSDGDQGDIDPDSGTQITTSDNDYTPTDNEDYDDDDSKTTSEHLDDDFDQDISLDQDGMYSIDVDAVDEATNENEEKQETYLVDSTQPDVDFSVDPGIFSVENGAIRKESKKGADFAYYGTLTFADNLSGVASMAYSWTYGEADGGNYETVYTSPYTTTDRYGELIRDDADNMTGTKGEVNKAEIEKPVGDNLYLHVKEIDTAGNETDATFGPYEDPIAMRDFEVTDVRDPLWDSVFWKDSNFTEPTGKTYKVNELPIDNDSHPTVKNAAPKMGYAFYFDVTTEFLYRDEDRIEIQPTFFYWDGKKRVPVDAYYNSNGNELTRLGSPQDMQTLSLDTSKYGSVLIGNLSDLTLTKGVRIVKGREWSDWKNTIQYSDGKIQWWYGKYFLPATSVFVKQGDKPTPENLLKDNNIIVNFQLIAYKNGIETLSSDQEFYYSPDQWKSEGGPKNSSYEPGDVMVYDNKYTVLSNFRSNIIQ